MWSGPAKHSITCKLCREPGAPWAATWGSRMNPTQRKAEPIRLDRKKPAPGSWQSWSISWTCQLLEPINSLLGLYQFGLDFQSFVIKKVLTDSGVSEYIEESGNFTRESSWGTSDVIWEDSKTLFKNCVNECYRKINVHSIGRWVL